MEKTDKRALEDCCVESGVQQIQGQSRQNQLHKDDQGSQGRQVKGVFPWFLIGPKAGEPLTKTRNSKEYYWCLFHVDIKSKKKGKWVQHTHEEYKSSPVNVARWKKEKEHVATNYVVDDREEQPSEDSEDNNPELVVDQAITEGSGVSGDKTDGLF